MESTQKKSFWRRHPKKLSALVVIVGVPLVLHLLVLVVTGIEPPALPPAPGLEVQQVSADPMLRRVGPAYARKRGGILEVRLMGTPAEIGDQHGRLLYPEMVENEGVLLNAFETYVPVPPVRWLITDISRWAYRNVDHGMEADRLTEIAAQARAFSPDPYDGFLPTFHRFVFLQALYDISLSFEHSPLIGCTSFALSQAATDGGHAMLARNFDFETADVFDSGKAVFLVHEAGRIPYASVSWPGLVGVVTGVNAEGLSVAVHGGRAREPVNVGEPVVHTTRALLGQARTTEEAIALLRGRSPMVSHILILQDAQGDAAVVERAPGAEIFVRRRGQHDPGLALTNHFEGPLSSDPRNLTVEQNTSTQPRRARLNELLSNLSTGASVKDVVAILRDKRGPEDAPLPMGHRDAIDALIATHAVVIDATEKQLWVSEGPHLVGRFIKFDLSELLDPGYEPTAEVSVESIAADPIVLDGSYDAWRRAGANHDTSE